MANELKVGDTVRLKSGGPIMTVDKISQNAAHELRAWCSWFDKDKRMQDNFVPETLVKEEY